MYPTDEQLKPLKRLKRALKDCKKAGVYLHNCYGTLHAFDGAKVHIVNDDPSDADGHAINEYEGEYFSISLPCGEYSDDTHYIHLKEP